MKQVLTLVLIGSTLFIGWAIAGPFLAMREIQQGAKEKDQARLEDNINFPLLRENLEIQLREGLDRKLDEKAEDKPWAILGKAFTKDVAEHVVGEVVTPEGILRLLDGQDWRKRQKRRKQKTEGGAGQAGGEMEAKEAKEAVQREWAFSSASEFELRVTREDKTNRFILTRTGLSWRLTNIILPER